LWGASARTVERRIIGGLPTRNAHGSVQIAPVDAATGSGAVLAAGMICPCAQGRDMRFHGNLCGVLPAAHWSLKINWQCLCGPLCETWQIPDRLCVSALAEGASQVSITNTENSGASLPKQLRN